MAFSFGFSGDDIDMDDSELSNSVPEIVATNGTANSLPELVKARKHDINEWLSILPSQIYYNRLSIGEAPITIARREIFDIRTQLMAEDNEKYDNAELIAGLEEGDLKPNFYEGGFKTWECALDLARLACKDDRIIQSLSNSQTDLHIIELGAGTAVPSLTLFAQILAQTNLNESETASRRKAHFTFADYNDAVLRLVTLPNLLLTWQSSRSQSTVNADSTQASSRPDQEEELDITPELIDEFKNDLARRGISIDLISGGWSPEFIDLVYSRPAFENCKTLVLASETIYSPATLLPFSETLLSLLRRSKTQTESSRAMVAAKKVYFGVGGGVDEFLAVLKDVCGDELQVKQVLDVQSEGVGRVVLEVGHRVD